MKKKEIIIWDGNVNYNDWSIDDYKEYLEDNNIDEDKLSFEEWVDDTNAEYLNCEVANLNVELNGKIIAIADLGLWNGRRSGYAIRTNNLNSIFHDVDSFDTYYCDRYNVKAICPRHDGTNYILFRELKDNVNVDTFLNKIYNGETITSSLSKYTKSLRPYVQQVYGFK